MLNQLIEKRKETEDLINQVRVEAEKSLAFLNGKKEVLDQMIANLQEGSESMSIPSNVQIFEPTIVQGEPKE